MLARLLMLFTLACGDDPAPAAPPETFTPAQRDHWSFQTPKRPDLPAVKEAAWPRNPIDAFILQGLESAGFAHAPEADRVTLIRRLSYDLTGLPPTPDEVDAFLGDPRPDAYERLVDRLLASPRFGERWAQHWLDLARYADTNGYEHDDDRPDGWRYRDWLVAALNADMPYDRFLTLQIAGDEAEPGDTSALIATGFARSGPREVVGGNIEPAVVRQNELTEVTGTVGSVFLGLTLACARCHDHKFDPLPTTDYYRLQAFFAAAKLNDLPIAPPSEFAAHEAASKAIAARLKPLRDQMATIEAPYRKALKAQKEASLSSEDRALLALPAASRTPSQKRRASGLASTLKVTWEDVAAAVAANPEDHAKREALKRSIHEIELTLPRPPAKAFALVDDKPEAPPTFVARRGDPRVPGPRVDPRPPGVLGSVPFDPTQVKPTPRTTGRRLALARWIAREDHPLTARVLVNRLWQHHVGRGLVTTPSDFGTRGEPPTHPELLDWLATELVASGWRMKPIHRLIVTSAAYRQSSTPAARAQAADDPENTLLSHMNRRRLDAESLRDAWLVASGAFNPRMGGPGVHAPIEPEVESLIFTEAEVVDLWPETPDPSEHLRRSLYLYRKRNVRYPLFDAFDAPDAQAACPDRPASTHPLQALILLNSPFAHDRARSLAGRLLRDAPEAIDPRVRLAYRVVLARDPLPDELAQAHAFLDAQSALLRRQAAEGQPLAAPDPPPPPAQDPAEAAAWVDFALAMLNRNAFLYVP